MALEKRKEGHPVTVLLDEARHFLVRLKVAENRLRRVADRRAAGSC